MEKLFQYIKRVLIGLFIAVVLFVATAISLTYLYQDKIIQHFVSEANKHLQTKVEVKKISFSAFEKFPQVAIRFDDIIIHESYKNSKNYLLKAHRIYFTFDIWDMINGQYKLHKVYISKGKAAIRLNKDGIPNYEIIKPDTSKSKKKVNFDLKKIILEEVEIIYANEQKNNTVQLYAHLTSAHLKYSPKEIAIAVQGNLTVHQINLAEKVYFKNKNIDLKSALVFSTQNKLLTIKPTSVLVEKSEFLVSGILQAGDKPHIDLSLEGINTNIQTILSLLSKDIYDKISVYKSKGDVYFKGKVTGAISNGDQPDIALLFGCQRASFYHPSIKKELTKTSFKGTFTSTARQNSLEISGIESYLDNRKISGEFKITNFSNPDLSFDLNADLNIASIIAFYPIKGLEYAKGEMSINLAFDGKLEDLKTTEGKKNINTSGEITVHALDFKVNAKPYVFSDFKANFLFNKNDVSINQFSGKIGNTDFALDGLFKNVFPFLFFKEEKIVIDAHCKSVLVDLDELLANSKQSDKDTSNYKFAISPRLTLDLNCNIGKLKFRKFNTGNIQGELKLNDRIVSTRNTSFTIAGGNITLNANLNTNNVEKMQLQAQTAFNNIIVDSVFYMFENFDQNFITHHNLRGRLSTSIDLEMAFNKNLQINPQSVKADVNVSLVNGQLLNFEPMQKLSKFVDAVELRNIKFKEIKNSIHIENKLVTIPAMVIKSNLNTIGIAGTHTFDNAMDYKLRVSLKNFKKKNTNEEENALQEEKDGGTTLFLKIHGTPPNIKISYDTKAVKEKIKERLKVESTEIKNLFKKRNLEDEWKKQQKVKVDENNVIDLDE
ncbi:MAG: hypothetical protein RL711_892 [Bacteroidota bacterium]|jgi:hypothetical protein